MRRVQTWRAIWIVCTIALAFDPAGRSQSSPRSTPPFLPSIEAPREALATWVGRFERSDFANRDALWCCYWHPERSTIASRFASWLSRTHEPRVRGDLEVILHHLAIDHACSLAPRPPSAFEFLPRDDGTPTATLRDRLDDVDRNLAIFAAGVLVRRGVDVERVARMLVSRHDLHEDRVRPLLQFIGFEADRALCAALEDPITSPERAVTLLTRIGFTSSAQPESIASTLSRLARRTERKDSYTAELALDRLAMLTLGDPCWRERGLDSDAEYHRYVHLKRRTPIPQQIATCELGRCLAARLESHSIRSTPSRRECDLLLLASACSPDVLDAVEPVLRRWLAESGARTLLAASVLSHAGRDDEPLQELALQEWRLRPRFADYALPDSAARSICLRSHSTSTRLELESAFERASIEERLCFLLPLEACGRRAAARDPLVARAIEVLTLEPSGSFASSWGPLLQLGFHGEFAVDSSLSEVANLYRLGMNLVANRSSARRSAAAQHRLVDYFLSLPEPPGAFGYSDPYIWGLSLCRTLDIHDCRLEAWAVDWLVNGDPLKFHAPEVARFLENRILEPALRPLVLHPSGIFVDVVYPDLAASQGEVALETVALWPRLEIQDDADGTRRIDLSGLERLLRVTRLAESDLVELAFGLRAGIAHDRLTILEFIARHRLTDPFLRIAVESARADCDPRVAQRAREWLQQFDT